MKVFLAADLLKNRGMRVRLLKKLAEMIDGVDLKRHRVGDYLVLRAKDAALLVAEGWAEIAERRRYPRSDTLIPLTHP